jgi:hypothetical protein
VYCSFHNLDRGFIYYIYLKCVKLQLTMASRQSDSANRTVRTVLCVCISVIYTVLYYCFGDFLDYIYTHTHTYVGSSGQSALSDPLLLLLVRSFEGLHYIVSVMNSECMEHWWNDADTVILKYSETNLSQCHMVHHKSHADWPETELGPPPLEND